MIYSLTTCFFFNYTNLTFCGESGCSFYRSIQIPLKALLIFSVDISFFAVQMYSTAQLSHLIFKGVQMVITSLFNGIINVSLSIIARGADLCALLLAIQLLTTFMPTPPPWAHRELWNPCMLNLFAWFGSWSCRMWFWTSWWCCLVVIIRVGP